MGTQLDFFTIEEMTLDVDSKKNSVTPACFKMVAKEPCANVDISVCA